MLATLHRIEMPTEQSEVRKWSWRGPCRILQFHGYCASRCHCIQPSFVSLSLSNFHWLFLACFSLSVLAAVATAYLRQAVSFPSIAFSCLLELPQHQWVIYRRSQHEAGSTVALTFIGAWIHVHLPWSHLTSHAIACGRSAHSKCSRLCWYLIGSVSMAHLQKLNWIELTKSWLVISIEFWSSKIWKLKQTQRRNHYYYYEGLSEYWFHIPYKCRRYYITIWKIN